jgi:CDP-diacylglycerol--glycerol-3-phosphate 3-phosphatidyltransferase
MQNESRTERYKGYRMELRKKLIKNYYVIIEKCLHPLAKKNIAPNCVSLLSLFLSLISSAFYAAGVFFMGGLTLLLSGLADTLDGSIARMTGRASRFGALLDSTLDRYAEFFIFFGLLIHFMEGWVSYVVIASLMGSIMVSYIKARAEALGSTKAIGLMQRPERLIVLALGSMLNAPLGKYFPECRDCTMITALILLAILTNITAIHRLMAEKTDLSRIK